MTKVRKGKGQDEIRAKRNSDLLRRMRQGEPLYTFDSQSSWFPPRPVIKKDKKEIARLYAADTEVTPDNQKENGSLSVVVDNGGDDHQEAS